MARRLNPVPDHPLRAVLYLRQSTYREESISLELQEAAGRDYCHRQGYHVIAVEADPGISGRTWRRPAVQRVMAMVEEKQADVIVLWRWSRLSRSRKDWAVAADRVDVAGGRIESATEPNDITAAGRFARGVMTEMAAFESERIGEQWKSVHAARLADGYAPNGKPRFGYVWNPALKLHEPDPTTGPVLAEAYRRYVAGASVYTLVRWLNADRVRTTAGNEWTDHSLRRVLDSGFGAGHIVWGGKLHPGRHTPLIDDETWQAYEDARVARRAIPARVKRSKYVLSGLVRCARCKGPMVANTGGARKTPSYRCARSKERGPEACEGGYVAMGVVRDAVLAWLAERAAELDEEVSTVDTTSVKKLTAEAETRRLLREVQRVDANIQRLTLRFAEDLVPAIAYGPTMKTLEAERAKLAAELDDAGRAARAIVDNPAEVASDLLARWKTIPVETRRETLGRLIARIEVTTGDRRGVKGTSGGASNARVEIFEP